MGGFEGVGATAQEEGKRTGPWLWQGWPWGAAAGEGGRRVNRLEDTEAEDGAHPVHHVVVHVRRLACVGREIFEQMVPNK